MFFYIFNELLLWNNSYGFITNPSPLCFVKSRDDLALGLKFDKVLKDLIFLLEELITFISGLTTFSNNNECFSNDWFCPWVSYSVTLVKFYVSFFFSIIYFIICFLPLSFPFSKISSRICTSLGKASWLLMFKLLLETSS